MNDPTIIVALITFAGTVLAAGLGTVGIVMRRQGGRLEAGLGTIRAVHHQVQNDHSTNLREDIDRVLDGIAAIAEGQRRHDAEIGGLRAELRLERKERIALGERLEH